jgi:predicted ATPase
VTSRSSRRVVVTGGPGGGKSTLIAALAEAGFETREEAGRKVIREELARGGGALPWGDRIAFAERMIAVDLEAFESVTDDGGPTFFDRGAPDVLGYLRLCRLTPPREVEAAARRLRYAEEVFLAPFWPEIFENDTERKQTPGEAERTSDVMARTYSALGYRVVELPRTSVAERVAFVLRRAGL